MNSNSTSLKGKKIAVLLETEYIHKEMVKYQEYFTALGARVDFMSYLWDEPSKTFICDIDSPDATMRDIHTMEVSIDVNDVNVEDYDAVLMGANYCSVRLREIPPMSSFGDPELLTTPPAVQFFAKAMRNKKIIKGCLCHALWILSPHPELLKDRKVTCHTVVLADVINAGGTFVAKTVVTDNDLITGRSSANLDEYCTTITTAINKQNT